MCRKFLSDYFISKFLKRLLKICYFICICYLRVEYINVYIFEYINQIIYKNGKDIHTTSSQDNETWGSELLCYSSSSTSSRIKMESETKSSD